MSARFIQELLREYLPDLPNKQVYMLNNYLFLLKKWNKVYNLTSITTAKAMVIRHVLDSLSISEYLQGKRIIDVGTGAGLPGIPLAICNPDIHFVLLDSNGKKERFLQQAKIELRLRNIEIVGERVEDYKPASLFDSVISRAFSSLNEFLTMTKHLACGNAVYIAMKGVYPLTELDSISKDFYLDKVEKLLVPGLNADRHAICAKMRRV
jgi:16S rRNA (guanine527-N7)-methyltransferase